MRIVVNIPLFRLVSVQALWKSLRVPRGTWQSRETHARQREDVSVQCVWKNFLPALRTQVPHDLPSQAMITPRQLLRLFYIVFIVLGSNWWTKQEYCMTLKNILEPPNWPRNPEHVTILSCRVLWCVCRRLMFATFVLGSSHVNEKGWMMQMPNKGAWIVGTT